MYFVNFKNWLNAFLIDKSKLCKVIGVVSFRVFIRYSFLKGSLIAFLVLILTTKTAWLSAKHHHLVETGLSLLAHSSVPQSHWDDAFQIACFLINRLPSPVTSHKSPFELFFQIALDLSFLRVFGSACWPLLRPYNKHKLDFRSKTCVFLGYSSSHMGYKCFDPISG